MQWTWRRLLEWFVEYHSTPEARRAARSMAARMGIPSDASDLHQGWYLSLRTTSDRAIRKGRPTPAWLVDERSAVKYVNRALRNDAVDLVRGQVRRPVPVDMDSHRDVVDLRDLPLSSDVELSSIVDRVRRGVVKRHLAGSLGSPACHGDRVAALALGVLEVLHAGQTDDASAAPTEWDRALYDALAKLDAERFTRVKGRITPAARQMKARCGKCVREVLEELFRAELDDEFDDEFGDDGGDEVVAS